MNILLNNVWANTNVDPQGNPYSLIIMLVIFAVIFYFMLFRPQQKRNKNHKKLLNSISKGDEILTNGGIVGQVIRITDTGYIAVILSIHNEKNCNFDRNNMVLIKRDYITAILPKGTMKLL